MLFGICISSSWGVVGICSTCRWQVSRATNGLNSLQEQVNIQQGRHCSGWEPIIGVSLVPLQGLLHNNHASTLFIYGSRQSIGTARTTRAQQRGHSQNTDPLQASFFESRFLLNTELRPKGCLASLQSRCLYVQNLHLTGSGHRWSHRLQGPTYPLQNDAQHHEMVFYS